MIFNKYLIFSNKKFYFMINFEFLSKYSDNKIILILSVNLSFELTFKSGITCNLF